MANLITKDNLALVGQTISAGRLAYNTAITAYCLQPNVTDVELKSLTRIEKNTGLYKVDMSLKSAIFKNGVQSAHTISGIETIGKNINTAYTTYLYTSRDMKSVHLSDNLASLLRFKYPIRTPLLGFAAFTAWSFSDILRAKAVAVRNALAVPV
jgi:hypothetical protein